MGDFSALSIGLTALQANQEAIDIVGQNVANANTSGYVDENADLESLSGSSVSGFDNPSAVTAGTGVAVKDISRLSDSFLQSQALSQTTNLGTINSVQSGMASVEQVFPEPESTSGIQSQLTSFWADWGTLASDTTSTSARSTVLDQAQSVAQAFNSASEQLTSVGQSLASQLGTSVATLNTWAGEVAKLNTQIEQGQAAGTNVNNLKDQRDQIVSDIAGDINIRTQTNSDGTENLYVGGQLLVSGGQANQMSYDGSNWSTTGPSLTWTASGNTVDATGGSIGGAMAFLAPESTSWSSTNPPPATSANTLAYYRWNLDQQASDLASAVNAQQAAGVDGDGNVGTAIFGNSATGTTTGITAANLGVIISDPSQLAAAGSAAETGVTGASTDNTNALAFSEFAANVDTAGNITIAGTPGYSGPEPDAAYQAMIGVMGVTASSYNSQQTSQSNLTAQATTALQSATGVDINEELTKMVMYQNAYTAAGKYESTVDDMLQTLLDDL